MATAGEPKRKVDKGKLELSVAVPKWVRPIEACGIDEEVLKIVRFFVVNSPCKGVSARGIGLQSYGWKDQNPPKNGYLQNRLLEVANLEMNRNLFIGSKREDMKKVFADASMGSDFCDAFSSNRAAFLSSKNLITDLFRAIRNSFAGSVAEVGVTRFWSGARRAPKKTEHLLERIYPTPS